MEMYLNLNSESWQSFIRARQGPVELVDQDGAGNCTAVRKFFKAVENVKGSDVVDREVVKVGKHFHLCTCQVLY